MSTVDERRETIDKERSSKRNKQKEKPNENSKSARSTTRSKTTNEKRERDDLNSTIKSPGITPDPKFTKV